MIEYFYADEVSKTKTPQAIKNKKARFMTHVNKKKGLHVSMMNQVWIEKSASETKYSAHFDNYQN